MIKFTGGYYYNGIDSATKSLLVIVLPIYAFEYFHVIWIIDLDLFANSEREIRSDHFVLSDSYLIRCFHYFNHKLKLKTWIDLDTKQ